MTVARSSPLTPLAQLSRNRAASRTATPSTASHHSRTAGLAAAEPTDDGCGRRCGGLCGGLCIDGCSAALRAKPNAESLADTLLEPLTELRGGARRMVLPPSAARRLQFAPERVSAERRRTGAPHIGLQARMHGATDSRRRDPPPERRHGGAPS